MKSISISKILKKIFSCVLILSTVFFLYAVGYAMASIPGYPTASGIMGNSEPGTSYDKPGSGLFFIADHAAEYRHRQEGTASYYAKKFNGRRTASGRRFSNNEFTAAHRKLPFGTIVKVTNTSSGESVLVEITDRGPFSGRRRIIDLSRKACELIGGHGVTKVEVESFSMQPGIPAGYYLGYSPDRELACLPVNSVSITDSSGSFTAAYEKYIELAGNYPFESIYLFVRPDYLASETPCYYLGRLQNHIVVIPPSNFEF